MHEEEYGKPMVGHRLEFRLNNCEEHGENCLVWNPYGEAVPGIEVPTELIVGLEQMSNSYPQHEWRIVCIHTIVAPLGSYHYKPVSKWGDQDIWDALGVDGA